LARFLLPDALLVHAGRCLHEHALSVSDGKIVGIIPAGEVAKENLERYSGELWVAGPILAHAHLEDYDFPAKDWQGKPFSTWAGGLTRWRGEQAAIGTEESANRTLAELKNAGCGLVAIHAGEAQRPLPSMPEVLIFREAPFPGTTGGEEWTPSPFSALHSPFLASEANARRVFRNPSRRVSVHLGEHPEERRFLSSQDGPLAELMESRGRPFPRERWESPAHWLKAMGGARPGVLAVHCGDLDAQELVALRRAGVSICWCPGTHSYFERTTPSFDEAGILPDCLGCDSRASNHRLDPLMELRLARKTLSHASPQDLWHALTAGGAASLGLVTRGTLEPGRKAEILAFSSPAEKEAKGICRWLSDMDGPVPLRPVETF